MTREVTVEIHASAGFCSRKFHWNLLRFFEILLWTCNYIVSKLVNRSVGDLKVPFSIAATLRCRGGCYFFPWFVPLILDLYLIMLSIKQGDIKYHFLSLWYDPTWDWILVSQTIGEHYANLPQNLITSVDYDQI